MTKREKADRSQWRSTLVRLTLVVGVVLVVGWSWLHLWDYYHPAAPAERRLWSGDPAERIAAVADLARFGREDSDVAIPALVEGLSDRDARVRAAAALAFVTIVPGSRVEKPDKAQISEAITALVESMNDPNAPVRAAAAEAAWMVVSVGQVSAGEPILKVVSTALIERLGDPDGHVRLAAIRGVGTLGPKFADEPPAGLVAALNDESERNRYAAAYAVTSFPRGLPPLLPALVRSLDAGDEQSHTVLLRILERVRPPLFAPAAIPGIVAALVSRDPKVIRVAAADLVTFNQAAGSVTPELAKTLDRWIEAHCNEPAPRNRQTLDLLIAIAGSLETLAPYGSSQDGAIAALVKLLGTNVDSRARIAAAKALGRFRPDRGLFTALAERIDDQDEHVRIAVMWAIDHADFGADFQVPRSLSVALESEFSDIRGAAAAALGHAGVGLDPIVPALLRHAAHDSDSEVRATCRTVLEVCTRPPKVTTAIIPVLIKALETPDDGLREVLCTLLSRFGKDALPAVPALVRVLKDARAESASSCAWIAAEALGDIAPGSPYDEQVVAALIESLEYPDLREPASSIRALASFGPKGAAAIPYLEKLQESKDDGVSVAATEALAKLTEAR